jgi:hypothetical protein
MQAVLKGNMMAEICQQSKAEEGETLCSFLVFLFSSYIYQFGRINKA